MRKSFIACTGIFLSVFMCAVVSAQTNPAVPVIDVTGRAVIQVEPDMATIIFSVETSGKTASDALKINALNTRKLMDALRNASGKITSIATSGFNIYPVYDRDSVKSSQSDNSRPIAFRVNNSVTVNTSGVNDVGSLIDAAIDAGANRIGSLSFGRSDYDRLQKQAAGKALQNAMEYGEELAKTAGLVIKRVLSVKYAPAQPVYGYQGIARAEERISTPITPGRVSVESSVNVTFDVQ